MDIICLSLCGDILHKLRRLHASFSNNSRILVSKIHLSSLAAEAAVRSKAVIPMFVVGSIACVVFVLGPCFMVWFLVSSLV